MTDAATGALMTEVSRGGRLGSPLYSEAVITDGAWHHVGLVWDGASRRLYVDDVLAAEDTQTALADCFEGLIIGCGKDMTPGGFFTGLIDDVRIYNRVIKP